MGNVSSTASSKNAKEIDEELCTMGYPDEARAILHTNWAAAAEQVDAYKESYGHGVSTKFMFCNVSGRHYLSRDCVEIVSGKDLDDRHTHIPRTIAPLCITAGFHARRDATATGSFGCVQFCVQDNHDIPKAFIVVAWGQPYSGPGRCKVGVSTKRFNVRDVADKCYDDKLSGTECQLGEPNLSSGDCIKVWTKTVEGSTAEIFVVMKCDTIVRKVYEGLPC